MRFKGIFRAMAGAAATLSLLSQASAEVPEIRLAKQFSMGYLQLNVMDHQKLIEKHAKLMGIPEVKVTWQVFNGPAAMNDALISGNIDIATGGVPGLLVVWSKTKGTPQEIRGISALTSQPVLLNTTNAALKTIADYKEGDKIAVPAVKSSVQAITLQMAAAKAFGPKEFAKLDPLTLVQRPRPRVLPDRDARLFDDQRGELAQQASPGRASARMHDPPDRVPSLQTERQASTAVGVEVKAQPLQVADASRRLSHQHLRRGAAHGPATSALGVAHVKLRAVVGRQHRRQSALRPVARRLSQRHGGEQRHAAALARRAQRRIQSSRACPHDRHVDVRVQSIGPPYGVAHPASVTSAAASTPSDSTTTATSATTSAFHFGCAARRVRAAAPQRRHQLCSCFSGAPHSGHASSRVPAACAGPGGVTLTCPSRGVSGSGSVRPRRGDPLRDQLGAAWGRPAMRPPGKSSWRRPERRWA